MSELVKVLCADLRDRWRTATAERDAGYSTETVLVTALIVILALAVLAIISAKVIAKANSINLG